MGWKEEMRGRGEDVRALLAKALSQQQSVTLTPRQIGDLMDYIQLLKGEK